MQGGRAEAAQYQDDVGIFLRWCQDDDGSLFIPGPVWNRRVHTDAVTHTVRAILLRYCLKDVMKPRGRFDAVTGTGDHSDFATIPEGDSKVTMMPEDQLIMAKRMSTV